MLSHLLDADTMAKLTDAQVQALNHNLELAAAVAILENPEMKQTLAEELAQAAAPLNP